MKKISHKKKWNVGTVKVHVDTPLIQNYYKLDKYYVKIKLCRYLASEKSDLYEFKMSFFDNGYTEEFLLLLRNLNMDIKRFNNFVCWFVDKCYVSLTLCLLR